MASYWQSTRDFVYRRRRPFLIVGGIVGGVYMAGSYAVSKLGEMQRRMVEERRDRDNLKRRFAQNQEDCNYTTLALLPTLGDQLFAHLDVERLTNRLQKGRNADATAGANKGLPTNGDIAAAPPTQLEARDNVTANDDTAPQNAMEEVWSKLGGGDTASKSSEQVNGGTSNGAPGETKDATPASVADNGSHSTDESKSSDDMAAPPSQIAHSPSAPSGLDAIAEPAPPAIPADARLTPSPRPSPSIPTSQKFEASPGIEISPAQDAPKSPQPDGEGAGMPLGEPGTSTQSKTTPNGHASAKQFDEAATHQSAEDILAEKRAKLALWNELKSAAFSRTITSLYSVVLLSLQTHIQLNLLGRYAYLTSVSSLSSSGPAPSDHQIRLERFDDPEGTEGQSLGEEARSEDGNAKGVDVQTERLYLTLSWWFLHQGWKRLAEHVQSAVDEVFGDVGLKTPLTHADLTSMLRKVRRRVEYEGRGRYGGVDDDATTLGASMASLDARSEWSEATTLRSGMGARSRGKRRDFSSILFPPAGQEMQVLLDAGAIEAPSKTELGTSLESLSPVLPALLDETRDILDSDDFWRVMKLGLRAVFEKFESELRPTFGLPPLAPVTAQSDAYDPASVSQQDTQPPTASIREVDDASAAAFASDEQRLGKSVRLASLFPAVSRQSTAAIHGTPNVYVDAMSGIKELKAFSAVIYSAWE